MKVAAPVKIVIRQLGVSFFRLMSSAKVSIVLTADSEGSSSGEGVSVAADG